MALLPSACRGSWQSLRVHRDEADRRCSSLIRSPGCEGSFALSFSEARRVEGFSDSFDRGMPRNSSCRGRRHLGQEEGNTKLEEQQNLWRTALKIGLLSQCTPLIRKLYHGWTKPSPDK